VKYQHIVFDGYKAKAVIVETDHIPDSSRQIWEIAKSKFPDISNMTCEYMKIYWNVEVIQ
jgi:expansin (peptidoglycan-binding protein)